MKEKIIAAAIVTAAVAALSGCSAADENLSEELPSDSSSLQSLPEVEEELPEDENKAEEEAEEVVAVYIKYIKVTADSVNIRSGAGTN